MDHQIAPRAQNDLDDIWLYVARESSSFDIATRLIETIYTAFLKLARTPYIGRKRDRDFGRNIRSFPVGDYIVLYLVETHRITIYRVIHGKRDLDGIVLQ